MKGYVEVADSTLFSVCSSRSGVNFHPRELDAFSSSRAEHISLPTYFRGYTHQPQGRETPSMATKP